MTIKQKAVARNLLENAGKSVSQAMLEEGYAPATAKNPQELTTSKGWAELMEDHYPDEELAKIGGEGLHAMKQIGALVLVKQDKDGNTDLVTKENEGMIEVPDHAVRHKYLETALKLKGRLKEGLNVAGDVIFNVKIERNA